MHAENQTQVQDPRTVKVGDAILIRVNDVKEPAKVTKVSAPGIVSVNNGERLFEFSSSELEGSWAWPEMYPAFEKET